MNDIYEIGFVIVCFGLVILLSYFEGKKGQKKWKELYETNNV